MIKFKHEDDQRCFLYISPKLGEIIIDMYQWFDKCGYEFVITSVIRKANDGSKSSTHQTGRAVDVRANHLDNLFIKDTLTFFNHKYKSVAAYSKSREAPTLIIDHGKSDNYHFHIQVDWKYENIYSQGFFKGEK